MVAARVMRVSDPSVFLSSRLIDGSVARPKCFRQSSVRVIELGDSEIRHGAHPRCSSESAQGVATPQPKAKSAGTTDEGAEGRPSCLVGFPNLMIAEALEDPGGPAHYEFVRRLGLFD